MKRLLILFMSIVMTLVIIPTTTAFAAEKNTTESYIEYFDDGSYLVTEIETNGISTMAVNSTTKAKTSSYYDTDNKKLWTVRLDAAFTYTGSSATCTSATASYTIYNSSWKVTSSTASKSGNKATGNFTVKKYILGVPTKTVNKTLTITYSNKGVCS